MDVKNLYYAYPSSNVAKKQCHAKTGCWFLAVGDEDAPDFNVVFSSVNKQEAIAAGTSLYRELTWGNYSMYKGESK